MVTLLQMAKTGTTTYPDSVDKIDYNAGNDAWRQALDKGVRVRVFKFEDVQKYKDQFLKLMACDNSESTIQMPDDELSIGFRLSIEQSVPRTHRVALGWWQNAFRF